MVYVTKWGALRHALNGALGVALHARALSWNGTATAASARAAWCVGTLAPGHRRTRVRVLTSLRLRCRPPPCCRCHSRSQLLYAAGNNPSNQSYIIGYTPSGAKAADRPHHRSSSCSPDYSVTCDWNNLNAAVSTRACACTRAARPPERERYSSAAPAAHEGPLLPRERRAPTPAC